MWTNLHLLERIFWFCFVIFFLIFFLGVDCNHNLLIVVSPCLNPTPTHSSSSSSIHQHNPPTRLFFHSFRSTCLWIGRNKYLWINSRVSANLQPNRLSWRWQLRVKPSPHFWCNPQSRHKHGRFKPVWNRRNHCRICRCTFHHVIWKCPCSQTAIWIHFLKNSRSSFPALVLLEAFRSVWFLDKNTKVDIQKYKLIYYFFFMPFWIVWSWLVWHLPTFFFGKT